MLRQLLPTIAAFGLFALPASMPAPAAAQWLGPHLDAQRYNNLRRHQQRLAQKRQAGRGDAWRRHVRACARRYPSYNARTDRYVVRRGVTARCRL